jgi:nucleoside-diphosphate-sugar epimerase
MLGANIVEQLLDGGCSVRAHIGRREDYRGPAAPGLELAEGDYTDGGYLRRALAGCDGVIHTASETSRRGRHYGDYYEANVRAVRRLIEAAEECGVRRVVVVSTADVFGFGSREIPGCELNEMCEPFASSYYSRSMYEGLKAAMSYSGPVEVVAVAPTRIVGRYCPTHGGAMRGAYGKKIGFCPPGGANFVHAGDAALGAIRALERGKSGETYILCSENLTWKEFYKKVGRATGKKVLHIRIPALAVYATGGTGSFLRATGVSTCLSLPNMRVLCATAYYHNYKASRDLGIEFRPVEEAIRDAARWLAGEAISNRCLK